MSTRPDKPWNPVELEVELFCRGLLVDDSARAGVDARRVARTRAGLGSGLELVIPAPRQGIWVNVPLDEPFVVTSPFTLVRQGDSFAVRDKRLPYVVYPVRLPDPPSWYSRTTKRGVPMTRVGVLQGTYLGVYFAETCMYWYNTPSAANCQFCTTGVNVGKNEELAKKVEDVVEVAKVAREESGVTFTHFNTGYHYEDDPKKRSMHGLVQARPFVSAIRRNVGGFIGVQAVPVLKECWDEYDELIELGCDHFSFCVELLDKKWFDEVCPGKASTVGQDAFFEALEYTAGKLGRGRVSGEIIAGLEPAESTKKAIDRIVAAGGFPTVCIFRPLAGSNLAHLPSPDPDEMRDVMAYQYTAARKAGLAVGILPNIKVSLVVQPEEGRELTAERSWLDPYEWKLKALRTLARPYAAWKKKPRPGARAFEPEIPPGPAVGN
jgi:hypothetical protein